MCGEGGLAFTCILVWMLEQSMCVCMYVCVCACFVCVCMFCVCVHCGLRQKQQLASEAFPSQ